MSRSIIVYDEETGGVRNVQVNADTFAIASKADGTIESMSYGQWEALRCRQAAEGARRRVAALDTSKAQREHMTALVDALAGTMRVKYLEGTRSWVQVFDAVLDAAEKLLA